MTRSIAPSRSPRPDGSIYRPTFNEASLLEKVDVNLRGALANGQPVWTPFVTNIAAMTPRASARSSNMAMAPRRPMTTTTRPSGSPISRPRAPLARTGLRRRFSWIQPTVQDLSYTYDPVGNITRIEDAALQDRLQRQSAGRFRVAITLTTRSIGLIEATGRETYRPIGFRLRSAGRQLPRLSFCRRRATAAIFRRCAITPSATITIPSAIFDDGSHQATDGNWTRAYAYDETSLIEPGKKSNRLSQTALQTNGNPPVEPYSL